MHVLMSRIEGRGRSWVVHGDALALDVVRSHVEARGRVLVGGASRGE